MANINPYRNDILEMHLKGIDTHEIAEKFGIKYHTCYMIIYRAEFKNISSKAGQQGGINADRHLCSSCQYRAWGSIKKKGARCEYILDVGHSRGCEVKDCDKYVKGKVIKSKAEPLLYGKAYEERVIV